MALRHPDSLCKHLKDFEFLARDAAVWGSHMSPTSKSSSDPIN